MTSDGILDQFTHEMFVIEKDKVPEGLRKLNAPGMGVVAWGLWTLADVKAYYTSPVELLNALKEAEEDEDWGVIRELISEMEGR